MSAARILHASSWAKPAKMKTKVKHLVNIQKTRRALSSAVPTFSSRLSRRLHSHNLLKRQTPQISDIQHLSVGRSVPLQRGSDRCHCHFALQVATMVVAILLSFVLIAELKFLPFRILALQGIPMFLAMVTAMYVLLERVRKIESVLD
jgi:hypothetical protein